MSKKFADVQIARNKDSADAWEQYAPHRRRTTDLLIEFATRQPDSSEPPRQSGNQSSLAVVGAGNCNDFDLRRLLDQFDQITLIDLDKNALKHALQQQRVQDNPRIRIKVCNFFDIAGEIASTGGFQSLMDALNDTPTAFDLGHEHSVAASVCVLSQLIEPLECLVEHPTEKTALLEAIRRHHLLLLDSLTNSKGRILLANEIVSTDTLPELDSSGISINQMVHEALSAGNFFTGLHPLALRTSIATTLNPSSQVATEPWLWEFVHRTYAVHAWLISK